VTHVRVKNDGDCFTLLGAGSETFSSLTDLVRYYTDDNFDKSPHELRDTNGILIELKYPLPSVNHHDERCV